MDLVAGYSGKPNHWRGVLKRGRAVVWTCPCHHKNRDQSSFSNGRSAVDCAKLMLSIIDNPNYVSDCNKAGYRVLAPACFEEQAKLLR